ncbi:hypothetical protein CDAR_383601, partial [Caerostris darwini]
CWYASEDDADNSEATNYQVSIKAHPRMRNEGAELSLDAGMTAKRGLIQREVSITANDTCKMRRAALWLDM